MSEAADREQVVKQCTVVVHMATTLAKLYSGWVRLHSMGGTASDDILLLTGQQSAALMEMLGDVLSGMDAVTEDDEWVNSIFAEAQRRFPNAHVPEDMVTTADAVSLLDQEERDTIREGLLMAAHEYHQEAETNRVNTALAERTAHCEFMERKLTKLAEHFAAPTKP